jgi:hypothetical protein
MSALIGSLATRMAVPAGAQAKASGNQGWVAGVAYTLTISVRGMGVSVGTQAANKNANNRKNENAFLFLPP